MIVVTPKRNAVIHEQCYGDMFGMTVEVTLQKGQKWSAKKSGGYWWLTRKGTGTRLRLTDTAISKLFVEDGKT